MCGSLCGVRVGRRVTYTGALLTQAHCPRSSPTCFRALLKTLFLAVVCRAQELSSSLRDTYRSRMKAQDGRGICLQIADSSCFTAEISTTCKAAILQLKKQKQKLPSSRKSSLTHPDSGCSSGYLSILSTWCYTVMKG